jgi:lipopolysaccharide export system permease protein
MRILDRYIIIQFIRNLAFALLCFILIFILVDLFENLDRFIDNNLGLGMVFNYYLTFVPEIVKLVTPISMLLATLFTAGRMINFNELVAVKNAGISLMRFMVPFICIGIVITGISMYFNNWVVPEANKQKFFIERNYLKRNVLQAGLNKLYFQDSKNQLILIETFREIDLTAERVTILLYNADSATHLLKRIDAEQMKWEDNKWVFLNAYERDFQKPNDGLTKYDSLGQNDLAGFNPINLVPQQITKKQLKPDEMNYTELNDFIDSMVKGGQNVDRQLVDFYSKISFPFSSIIVIIFGISISTGTKRRKGIALQFGISMLVSFIYLGFVKISQSFGYNGDLNPMFTAWLANLLFFGFGVVNLYFKNY